jgi:formamidopyrimidine-DNA glycosylase
MPDGIDVESMTDEVGRRLVGRAISQVKLVGGQLVENPPCGFEEFQKSVNSRALTVQSVNCQGAFMYWTLDNDWTVWFTLDESCNFTSNKTLPHATIRWAHVHPNEFDRMLTRLLFFTDQQDSGTIQFVRDPQALEDKLLSLSAPAIHA